MRQIVVSSLASVLILAVITLGPFAIPASAQEPEWQMVAARPAVANQLECPYGRYTFYWTIFKMANDGSTTWDFFLVTTQMGTRGGSMVPCNSGWRTGIQYLNIYLGSYTVGSTYIVDYGPTTTVGSSTVSYTVGVSLSKNPGLNLGVTVAYTVADVQVFDESDLQNPGWGGKWHHMMIPSCCGYKKVQEWTYESSPSVVIRAAESDAFYVYLYYQAQFGYWSGSSWWNHWNVATPDASPLLN